MIPKLMDYMPRGPFSYAAMEDVANATMSYRIADVDDNRIATCYDENNARFIVAILNQERKQ